MRRIQSPIWPQRYDLIVLDHPHLGDAVAAGCLVPLESVFAAEEIAAWAAASVGRSFASYRYAGKYWALPLDAATQVAAFRSELLQDEPPPATWDAVITLAQRRPVCLSLAGPHAALTFMSICTALGEPPASKDSDQFVNSGVGTEALAIMAAIHGHVTRLALGKNPIGILRSDGAGRRYRLLPADLRLRQLCCAGGGSACWSASATFRLSAPAVRSARRLAVPGLPSRVARPSRRSCLFIFAI